MLTVKRQVMTKKGNSFEVVLPGKRVLCPTCDGKGSHVNPSVDGHGLSSEDFAEDPDFAESYFRGDYDVACRECAGEKVIIDLDESRITAKMLERIHRQQDQDWKDDAEYRSEARLRAHGG